MYSSFSLIMQTLITYLKEPLEILIKYEDINV